MKRSVVCLVLALALPVTGAGAATSGSGEVTSSSDEQSHRAERAGRDDLPHPLGVKQRALRAKAHERALRNQVQPRGRNKVVQVAAGQYVELAQEGSDRILTLLGEFSDAPAVHEHGGHGGNPGPLHNQIPRPDRTLDNTTIWREDFSRQHYETLLYSREPGANSMANFYLENSSGRYTVEGIAGDWVRVPYNQASYGSNYCGSIVCRDTWNFVQDQADAWYASLLANGMTPAEIDGMLARFDEWDRYDHDGDGNFDEPDGYIDHFQSVHAGAGEETGGGEYGSQAIWSHRWYAFFNRIGSAGPGGNLLGGAQIGDSRFWIGDYTIEPENGGVGVFAHEFAHDLGLPDLYDQSGNTGGAENSTGFWTIMSSGTYGNDGTEDLGSKPVHFGAWEKLQLGWLTYGVGQTGQRSTHRLGPAETTTKHAQALLVLLPDKVVTVDLGPPFAGEQFYYSGSGDDIDHRMTKAVTLAPGSSLSAQVRYDIEVDWDYAYVVVSTDGGASWEEVPTNRSTTTDPHGQNFGFGITGDSGGQWVPLTADLSAYTGDVLVGFRYWTDVAVVEPGFMVDDVLLGSDSTPDGAEPGDDPWTLTGFRPSSGLEQNKFFNAYVAEYRQYRGYDDSLRTGPYNFGFFPARPDYVERFSYEDGLLISYWDSSHSDNNVGNHPGGGLILPVDAHPRIERWSNGTVMRPRIQSYDSTFGLEPTTPWTLHRSGVPAPIASQPAAPLFDDRRSYWTPDTGDEPGHHEPEWVGVDVPRTGTSVRVVGVSTQDAFMQVNVNG